MVLLFIPATAGRRSSTEGAPDGAAAEVDPAGVEPAASAVQRRRSSSWSYGPAEPLYVPRRPEEPAFRQLVVTDIQGKLGSTPSWIRTSVLQLRKLALYPLSYGREKCWSRGLTGTPADARRGTRTLTCTRFKPRGLYQLGYTGGRTNEGRGVCRRPVGFEPTSPAWEAGVLNH